MTMTTISLSIRAIERQIFALSALRSYYNKEKRAQVPLLTTDRRDALEPLIRAAIGETALKAGGTANLSGEGDIVDVTVGGDDASVRSIIEQGCALRVLQMANIGYDSEAAADYGKEAEAAIESVQAALAGRSTGGRIVPNFW